MSGATADRPLRVVMFPELGSTDPNCGLLNDALARRGIDVQRGRVLDRRGARAAPGTVDAVRLHWLEFLFWPGGQHRLRRLASMYAQGLRLMGALRVLRASEIRVIWTVDNFSPHETSYPRLHWLLRSAVLRAAEVVVVHSHYAADKVRALLAPAAPVRVVPHGEYRGAYGAPRATRAQTRERLGAARRCVRVSDVRQYSVRQARSGGDSRLSHVARRRRAAARRGRPRIARGRGRGGRGRRSARAAAAAPCPDEEVVEIFHAADVLVVNYVEVLSSGALLLGLCFGLPAVAPAAGSAVELALPPATIPFAEGELTAALVAARRDPEERGRAARAVATRPSWAEAAALLESLTEATIQPGSHRFPRVPPVTP